jgi:hypothetical protein
MARQVAVMIDLNTRSERSVHEGMGQPVCAVLATSQRIVEESVPVFPVTPDPNQAATIV